MITSTDHTAPDTPSLDCGSAVRMLWDYLDGNLDAVNESAVRAHVARCSHCFPHANFGQIVIDAMAQLRDTPDSAAAARDGVLARLRAEGYEGT
jgi:anti-sigma factor RsiW